MSSDRIAQLHEQASERYLNGDYDGAAQAWRDILALDPANQQARDGLRLAAQYVPHDRPSPAPPELEEAVEEGLSVFDSLGSGRSPAAAAASAEKPPGLRTAPLDPGATLVIDRSQIDGLTDRPSAHAPAPDPARQSEGIDFGDIASVQAIPLGDPAPDGETESVGLAPAAPDPPSATAAAHELQRRVADLLEQAKAKAAAGERDEALAILGRLSILDEDNAEAEALRLSLEGAARHDLEKVEQSIIEGVSALEADKLDEAERCMREALALAPDHREALHYLETIQARRAHRETPAPPAPAAYVPPVGEEDLLSGAPAPAPGAPHPAPFPGAHPKALKDDRPRLEPVAIPTSRRSPLSGQRLFLLLGLAAAGVAAVVLLPRLAGGGSRPALAAAAPAPRPARPGPKPAAAPGDREPSGAAASPEDRAKEVASDVAEGRSKAEAGDFGAAVIAFNDALKLDPANAEARTGLLEAGERYKAQRARTDAIEGIRAAFRDGEYASALRTAYRLPDGVDKATADRIKVAGWYDLGVVALRAGDCKEAESHFKDALAIAPDDAEAKHLLQFAGSCQSSAHDRAYFDAVEAMPFRTPQI